MRDYRTYGSEGGETQINASSLPLSFTTSRDCTARLVIYSSCNGCEADADDTALFQ